MYAIKPYRILECMMTVLSLFCVLIFCTTCSDESTHDPEFTIELQQEMGCFVDEKMAEYNVPGAVIGIWVPGQGTWLKAKGKANIEADTDMSLTHTFRIGSINTTFPVVHSIHMTGNYSHGYLEVDGVLKDYTVSDHFIQWGAGCMISDLSDLEL